VLLAKESRIKSQVLDIWKLCNDPSIRIHWSLGDQVKIKPINICPITIISKPLGTIMKTQKLNKAQTLYWTRESSNRLIRERYYQGIDKIRICHILAITYSAPINMAAQIFCWHTGFISFRIYPFLWVYTSKWNDWVIF
jgi:hypothetical protein